MARVVASIEARMGSGRLPGKVIAPVNGVPALTRTLRRLRQANRLDDIVLATTVEPRDDALVDWARSEGVAVYRGSENDVLQRVVDAQVALRSDVVVEITGDCTLIDPIVIDWAIDTYFKNKCDVVSNTWHSTFPQGVDAQVFSLSLLQDVAEKIEDPAVREHVSIYFYENPDKYSIFNLIAPSVWAGSDLRFQLDYPEDLQFLNAVYERLEPTHGDSFGTMEVLQLLQANPELAEINAHCENKSIR